MPQTWPNAFAEGKHLPWTRGMLVKEFELEPGLDQCANDTVDGVNPFGIIVLVLV
jgi:hypothetical protein